MKKREIKVAIGALIVLVFIIVLLLINSNNTKPIKLEKTPIYNEGILQLSQSEKDELKQELINYLNKKDYYVCDKIEFYNNQSESADNTKYFYALVIGGDRSLIEITKLDDGTFKFTYISNQTAPDTVSSNTGVSYKQIVNYKDYIKQKELENMREDMKNDLPDDDEIS